MIKTLSLFWLLLMCCSVIAVPVTVSYLDTDRQDVLLLPTVYVHELGVGFPSEELIEAGASVTDYTPCAADYDQTSTPSYAVSIQNFTGRSWTDLWYVADPETSLTNDDGWINSCLAFKIDSIGLNKALVSESIIADGIFEQGEIWTFVIQNYSNSKGLGAEALASVGRVGTGSVGDQISSGSIIAIPEPVTVVLLAAGGLALSRRR